MERQRSFANELLPVANLPTDLIIAADTGNQLQRSEAILAPDGNYYESEDSVDELIADHDNEVLTTFFNAREEWIREYCESDDYLSNFDHIIAESDFAYKQLCSYLPRNLIAPVRDYIFDQIIENHLRVSSEDQYSSPDRFYLDSFSDGEYEDQFELSELPELWGSFSDWVDTQNDFTINGNYLIVSLCSRIEFSIDGGEETLNEILTEAILFYCRNHDNHGH